MSHVKCTGPNCPLCAQGRKWKSAGAGETVFLETVDEEAERFVQMLRETMTEDEVLNLLRTVAKA